GDKTAIEMLILTLQRKNRAVEERAKKHKFHKSGLIEAKCAELLGDLGAKSAVEALTEAIKQKDEMPAELQTDPNKQNAFRMGQVQRYISIASALAMMGDPTPIDHMVSRLDVEGDYREILIASIQQLGFLGSPKAVPGLMKRMKKEPGLLDPDGHGLRIQMAINVLNIIDEKDNKSLSLFEKEIKSYQSKLAGYEKELTDKLKKIDAKSTKAYEPYFKAYKDWDKNYQTILTKLDTIKSCAGDQQLSCWFAKLNDADKSVRTLAAYRLAQIQDPSVSAQLIKAIQALNAELKDKQTYKNQQKVADIMALRNVLLFGVARQGTVADIPALKSVRAEDRALSKLDKSFKGLLYPMDLLLAKLSHRL
ncbi:hypothetical protein KKF91_08920, partial [Myxococcota bacterium]|nr:hypothetical protein [Myxococcota bacterium]